MTASHLPTTDEWIDELALQIGRRRLEAPAIALLEVARPFSFVASQGLLLVQPLLGFLLGESRVRGYAGLVADRANIDRLISVLVGAGTGTADGDKVGQD